MRRSTHSERERPALPNYSGKLATVPPDRRDPSRMVHPLPEILLAHILAIACGCEDADDLDHLRADPAFKLACGRLPESGPDLMSQPTVSRLENTPRLRDLIRLGRVLINIYCASYAAPPDSVTLDIDDTCDMVHGHQQLSLFNAHHDTRCFLPIHVCDTATSRPVTMILRPGKTPAGREVRGRLRRLVRARRDRHAAAAGLVRSLQPVPSPQGAGLPFPARVHRAPFNPRGHVRSLGGNNTRRYADLAVAARNVGKGFPTPDGYIAAIATAHGFTVATRDASAFKAAGVLIIDPWTVGR